MKTTIFYTSLFFVCFSCLFLMPSHAAVIVDTGAHTITGDGTDANDIAMGGDTYTATPDSGGITLSGILSGTGGLTQAGPGALSLTGANTYTGLTTISGGTLTVNNTDCLSATSGIVLSGGTLNTTGNNMTLSAPISVTANSIIKADIDTTFTGAISGSANIEKTGGAVMRVNNMTGYTGQITVSAGYIGVNAATFDGSGADFVVNVNDGIRVDVGGLVTKLGSLSGTGTIRNGANNSVTYQIGGNNHSTTFNGVIAQQGTGVVSLDKVGTGTLTLAGTNTYTGATTISGGTLAINSNDRLATTSGINIQANGTLNITATTTITPALTGNGNILKTGNDSLRLNNLGGFTGKVTVADGYNNNYIIVNNEFDGSNADFEINTANGMRIDVGGLTAKLGSLSGTGTIRNGGDNTATYQIGSNNRNSTFSGVIAQQGTGVISLVKVGTGTLTLSGTNTYTGTTTIQGGVLAINANTTINAASQIVLDGGTLRTNFGDNMGGRKVHVASESTWDLQTSYLLPDGGISGSATLHVIRTSTNAATYMALTAGTSTANFTGTLNIHDNGWVAMEAANCFNADASVIVGTTGQLEIRANQSFKALTMAGGTLLVKGDGSTLTAPISATANSTIQMDNNGKIVASTLSGSGNLAKTGTGTLALEIGGGTYSGVISGNQTLTKTGTDTLTLTGTSTFTGRTTVSGGVLDLTTGKITGNGGVTIKAGGTLKISDYANGGSLGELASASGNRYIDGGILEVTTIGSGSNNKGFTVSTNGGTFRYSGADAFTLSRAESGASLILEGTLTLDVPQATATIVVNNILTGAGGLTKTGAGTVTIPRTDNAVKGKITVNAGTLAFTAAQTFGNAGIEINGGVLDLTNNAARLNDTGVVTVNEGGTLKARSWSNDGSLALDSLNTNRTISGGTIEVTTNDTSGGNNKGMHVTSKGGTFAYSGADNWVYAQNSNATRFIDIDGDGTGVNTGASAAILNMGVKEAAATLTIDTRFRGRGGLNKTGAGTLTLNKDNDYAGETSVSGGILKLATTGLLSKTSKITINSGGTLVTTAASQFSQASIALNGGTFQFDMGLEVMTAPISVAGNSTLDLKTSYYVPGAGITGGSTAILNITSSGNGYLAVNAAGQTTGFIGTFAVNNNGWLALENENNINAAARVVADATGKFEVRHNQAFDSLTLNGGTLLAKELKVNDVLLTIGSINVTKDSFIQANGTAAQTLTLAAAINGAGYTVTKTGDTPLFFLDDVTLGGLSVAGGPVTFGGGAKALQQVKIDNLTSAGSAVTMNTGAGNTLQFAGNITGNVVGTGSGRLDIQTGGTNRITGNLDIGTGLTFSPGNSIGQTIVGGNFSLAHDAELLIEVAADGSTDYLKVFGQANFDVNSFITLLIDPDYAGDGGTFILTEAATFGDPSLDWESMITVLGGEGLTWEFGIIPYGVGFGLMGNAYVTPEPATWLMLLFGAAGLLLVRKRRK